MHNQQNSYHIQRAKEGFIIFSTVKCCAMCEMCSSSSEWHDPIMSMDDEQVEVKITYCVQRGQEKIEDTSKLPDWCPAMEILRDRDVLQHGDPVDNMFAVLFPES